MGNGIILIKRKKREPKQKDIYAGVNLYTENETIGDVEYEIDKEKFMGRGNFSIPEAIKNSKPFSKNLGLVTGPGLVIKKTVKILPGETATLDLIISAGYDEETTIKLLQNYSNQGGTWKEFNVPYEKVYAKKKAIQNGSETIWQYAEELLNDSVEKGFLEK